jgi:hypothetical protein
MGPSVEPVAHKLARMRKVLGLAQIDLRPGTSIQSPMLRIVERRPAVLRRDVLGVRLIATEQSHEGIQGK